MHECSTAYLGPGGVDDLQGAPSGMPLESWGTSGYRTCLRKRAGGGEQAPHRKPSQSANFPKISHKNWGDAINWRGGRLGGREVLEGGEGGGGGV